MSLNTWVSENLGVYLKPLKRRCASRAGVSESSGNLPICSSSGDTFVVVAMDQTPHAYGNTCKFYFHAFQVSTPLWEVLRHLGSNRSLTRVSHVLRGWENVTRLDSLEGGRSEGLTSLPQCPLQWCSLSAISSSLSSSSVSLGQDMT